MMTKKIGTRQDAMSKINSMKITLFNAISELEVQASNARKAGNNDLSSKLSLQSVALAKLAIKVRKAEDAIRLKIPLISAINELAAIAGDARSKLADLRKTEKFLDEAAKLITIIAKVATVFA